MTPAKQVEELTPEIARKLLYYNPLTGSLSWRARGLDWFSSYRSMKSWNSKYALKKAGSIFTAKNGHKNLRITVSRKKFSASRAAWMVMTGEIPQGQLWHINRNSLDLRWRNLTCCDQGTISRNGPMLRRNSSGFRGVSWDKQVQKWRAHIQIKGRYIHLGYFSDIEEAAEIREQANMLHGFSAAQAQAQAQEEAS